MSWWNSSCANEEKKEGMHEFEKVRSKEKKAVDSASS